MEWLCAAHDFLHIQRVVENAKKISNGEGIKDTFLIEIWALLHESLDTKFFPKENKQQRKKDILHFLENIGLSQDQRDEVLFIIENVGYSKELQRTWEFIGTQNFKIVEDADRLEAIWAIAIARCFSYWGKIKRPIYDPEIAPFEIDGIESYEKTTKESTSFNHFFEKLLLLKDQMHTETGKKLATPKHTFMQVYVEQFLKEWNGEI